MSELSERRVKDLEDALRDAIRVMSSRGLIAASNRAQSVLENQHKVTATE